MTDRLWQFMRNIHQPWNHDVMAFFLQEGLKLSKPGGICAVNAVLWKCLKVKDHPSNPQFLPIFRYIIASMLMLFHAALAMIYSNSG